LLLLPLLAELLLLPLLSKLQCSRWSFNSTASPAATTTGTAGAAPYKHFVLLTSSQLQLPVLLAQMPLLAEMLSLLRAKLLPGVLPGVLPAVLLLLLLELQILLAWLLQAELLLLLLSQLLLLLASARAATAACSAAGAAVAAFLFAPQASLLCFCHSRLNALAGQ
jgi:hypothetical protein